MSRYDIKTKFFAYILNQFKFHQADIVEMIDNQG